MASKAEGVHSNAAVDAARRGSWEAKLIGFMTDPYSTR